MDVTSWHPDMRLGVPSIDAAHESFLRELAKLADTRDDDFGAAFQMMVARMEQDFREEDLKMEEIDYPALACHREQHARVLGTLHQVAGAVMAGDIAMGRTAVALLPQWFMVHLSTMDTALALTLELVEIDGAAVMHAPPQGR